MRDIVEYVLKPLAGIIVILSMSFLLCLFTSCNGGLKKENERLRKELALAQQYVPLKRDTIRDTIEVVTQKVVEAEKIKGVLSKDDKELIKDLSMKVSELESYQKMSNIIHDTIILTQKDSTPDSPLYYKDAWAEFEFNNNRLSYSVKDSLAIALKKEYKHRFLWLRWGTKGYEVKAISFNPHATIKYNTYIKRK